MDINPIIIFKDKYKSDDEVLDLFQDILDEYNELTISSDYFIQYPKASSLVYHKNFNKLCISPFFEEKKDPYLVRFHRIKFSLITDGYSTIEQHKKSLLDNLKFIEDIEFCLVRLPGYKIQTSSGQGNVIGITLSSEIQAIESDIVSELYELVKPTREILAKYNNQTFEFKINNDIHFYI